MTLPIEIIQQAIDLYQKDRKSILEISNQLSISYNSLRKELIKHICLRRIGEINKSITAEQEKDIINKYLSGNTIRGLAKEYDRDKQVISRILRENNIPLHSSQQLFGKDIDIIKMNMYYQQGESFHCLSKMFNISTATVIRKLRLVNPDVKSKLKDIDKQNSSLPKEIQDNICQQYLMGSTCVELAIQFNIDRGAISRCLKSRNIKLRKSGDDNKLYTINESVFKQENIHNPIIYIVLGLLFTDGSVRYGEKKSFIIELNDKDKLTLDFINKSIGSNRPLLSDVKKNSLILTVSNKEMAKDLINLGCVPNKTNFLSLPSWIRDDLFSFFLHGVIMGDGWIFHNKEKNIYNMGIVGTYDFCLGIQNKLIQFLDIKGSLKPCTNSLAWRLTFGGNNDILKLCNFIFNKTPFVMQRKFNVFKTLVEYKISLIETKYGSRTNINELNKAKQIIVDHQ